MAIINRLFPELQAFRGRADRTSAWRGAVRAHALAMVGCLLLIPTAALVLFGIFMALARSLGGVHPTGSRALAVFAAALAGACVLEVVAAMRLRRSMRAHLRVQLALHGVNTCRRCGFVVQLQPDKVCGECGESVWS